MALITEHLSDIGVLRLSRWCFNTYLIAGDGGRLVVVDAGIPRITTDLDELLPSLPGRIAGVTATHGHADHVGGASWLADRHGVPVHLPAATMAYFDGATPRTPSVRQLART